MTRRLSEIPSSWISFFSDLSCFPIAFSWISSLAFGESLEESTLKEITLLSSRLPELLVFDSSVTTGLGACAPDICKSSYWSILKCGNKLTLHALLLHNYNRNSKRKAFKLTAWPFLFNRLKHKGETQGGKRCLLKVGYHLTIQLLPFRNSFITKGITLCKKITNQLSFQL